MNDITPRSTFHPYRSKAWFPFIAGAAVLLLAILLAWGLTGEDKKPFDLRRAFIAAGLVIIDPIGLFSLWVFSVGIANWRAHVAVADDGLDIYAHRFSMWSLRRMRRAKLPWSEVVGVQLFALTNFMAPGGVQREFIVYTSAGEFVIPELMWPDAQQIAEQISGRIGKPIGDISAVRAPITGKRPGDLRGTRVMHGIGWFAQLMGWIFAVLSVIALFGGANFRSMSYMLMMSMSLVLGGASLRRFRMG
jgi:hypothetical protein